MAPLVKIKVTEDGWYAICGLYYVVCGRGKDFEQDLKLRWLLKSITIPFVCTYAWRSVEVCLNILFQKFGGVPEDTQAALKEEIRAFIVEKRANKK